MNIQSRITKTELVNWKQLAWLQPDDFKEMHKSAFEKLKASIKANGFAAPFFVWDAPEGGLILDGVHRKRAMLELINEGHEVSEMLPANFVQCTDRKEALLANALQDTNHMAQSMRRTPMAKHKLKSVQLKNHKAAVARVKEMKRLLVSSELLQKEICYAVGIREDSGARLFRAKTGTTMTLWRRRNAKT